MQLVNVICGGTLHQYVLEDVMWVLYYWDLVENTLCYVLEIVFGIRVDVIYGFGEICVNSYYYMVVNQVVWLFCVLVMCLDGVIEVFESIDDDWYCFGVQWYLENEICLVFDMQVFENFFDGC